MIRMAEEVEIEIGMVEGVVVEGDAVAEAGDQVEVVVVVVRWRKVVTGREDEVEDVETITVLTKVVTGKEDGVEDAVTPTTTITIDTTTTGITTTEITTRMITPTRDGNGAKLFQWNCASLETETQPHRKKYAGLPWRSCSPCVSRTLHRHYHGSRRVGPIPVHHK